MRTHAALLVGLAIGFLGPASAQDETIHLEPKWKAGDRALVELVTRDYLKLPGAEATLQKTRTVEYEEEATEVKDGIPTRALRTFKRFEAQRIFADTPTKYSFDGRTVEFQGVEGVLQCKENMSEVLIDPMSAGADWAWLLPGKAVAVGEYWKVPRGMHLVTVHAALVAGETTCGLASVKNGIARLRFFNENGVTGEAAFSLDAGRFMKASLDFVSITDEPALGKSMWTTKLTFQLRMLEDERDAASAKGAPIRLEPKWNADERVLVKLVTKTYLNPSGAKAKLEKTRTVEYEEKATEVKDGVPMRALRTFTRFETQRGSDRPREDDLARKTVELRNRDGVLQCREQASPELMRVGADWTWLLPGKAVAVGDSWKIRAGMQLAAVHLLLIGGETECELASVKDGIALLRWHDGEGLTGKARFSLDAGRVVGASLELDQGLITQKVTFELEIVKGRE